MMQMQPHNKQGEVTQGQVEPTRQKQVYGMNYFETYAPVVTWFAIRLMIIFGIIFCLALQQVDFVMAYPQAPIKMDIYMKPPQGIQTKQLKRTCFEAIEEYLQPETGWAHVEFIPRGQTHIHRIHNINNR
jgi:hypothetical protein